MVKSQSPPSSEPQAASTEPTQRELDIQRRAAKLLQTNTFTAFDSVLRQYAQGIIGDVRHAIRLLENFERRNNDVREEAKRFRKITTE